MPSSILDASAMLAYVHDEPGAGAVEEALFRGSAINLVNWAEVLTVVVRRGGKVADFEQRLSVAGVLGPDTLLNLMAITREDAERAANLYPLAAVAGLSLGDRFCYATGLRLHLPILTAERSWPGLAGPGAQVRLIRGE